MLSKEQAAIIGAYTGYACGLFSDIHEYAEKKFGHPILSHQFGDKDFMEKLRLLAKEDFINLCYKGV